MTTKVDQSKIATPKVFLTEPAWNQITLILENDFTLKGKYLRLLISGKGCDGFTYSVGFTDWNESDFIIPVNNVVGKGPIEILMDPFTAFYLQDCLVDYIQDFANNNDGLVVINKLQKQYSGKFWRNNEDLTPPTQS